ncbi:hypothetical protein [Sphingomonas tagetis]|nr:hypothetical protein [Sphingomonas tagetis]
MEPPALEAAEQDDRGALLIRATAMGNGIGDLTDQDGIAVELHARFDVRHFQRYRQQAQYRHLRHFEQHLRAQQAAALAIGSAGRVDDIGRIGQRHNSC